MLNIEKQPLPANSFLKKYEKIEGCFTDCYMTSIDKPINFANYVNAFYTTPLFKLERVLLRLSISKPSTDNEAQQLANAKIDTFSAWKVEERSTTQLLMCDISKRTRSWFMIESINADTKRLYFGSAVVPVRNPENDKHKLGFMFTALLGFHKLYSIALLYSARAKLQREIQTTS